MANQAQYSYNYMVIGQAGAPWPNTQFGSDKNFSCISLIETADMRHKPKVVLQSIKGPGAIHISYERTCVVTRILFLFPRGPRAMFGPELQAHKIKTNDFMFHPKATEKHGADDQDDEEDANYAAQQPYSYYQPKRRKRR